MVFSYIRIDTKGQQYKEKVEALSLQEAQEKLQARGIWYKKLKPAFQTRLLNVPTLFQKKVAYKQLAGLSRNLSIYLKAGVPILTAINLTKNQQDNRLSQRFLESIAQSLEEGSSLYVAMETQKVLGLPDFYKYSLKVAEESGTLQQVLEELATYMYNLDSVQKRINQALIYPGFIITLAVLMISFMLSVVVPKITQIFDSLDQELPDITQFVIASGEFFEHYWLVLSMVVIALVLFIRLIYKKVQWYRLLVDRMLLKIPVYSKVLSTWELARFSYIASILVHSGITFIHAVKLATNTIGNAHIKKQFEEATADVVEGKKLSQALLASGFSLDASFLQAIALGEETSEIDSILKSLSELYLQENNDRITVFLSLFEPVLILFVGVTIGIIVTAMLLPIFSMDFGI